MAEGDPDIISSLSAQIAALTGQVADLSAQLQEVRAREDRPPVADESLALALEQLGRRVDEALGQGAGLEADGLRRHRLDIDEIFRRLKRGEDVTSGTTTGGGGGNLREATLVATAPALETGDRSTEPSNTYDVYDTETGALVASGVALTGHGVRVANATLGTLAGHGVYRKPTAGTVRLIFADERYHISGCPGG